MKKLCVLLVSIMLFPFGLASASVQADGLKVDMHYVVVEPDGNGSVLVKHMVSYTNPGEKEYQGNGNGSISVTLPKGAINLQVQDESLGAKPNAAGFSVSKPVPGKGSIVLPYTYQMPAGIPIAFSLDYPLEIMQVLVPDGKGSIEFIGAESSSPQQIDIDGRSFWMYSLEHVDPGKEIKFAYAKDQQPASGEDPATIDSSKNPSTASDVTRKAPDFHNPGHIRLWEQSALKKFNPHVLLVVLGMILFSGISYYSYFRWKNRIEDAKFGADEEEAAFKQLLARQNAIMDKIMELEDTYAQGKVSEEEYSVKLDAYKEHLVQVKMNLRQFVE
ncbi:hypothetical protein [Mesobacillus zeae]|uniref:Uncharacterized protein n=1 Tax=Mesobacillus zeae TaxID=1917180 RepID=A0A398B3B5_9BACI|nr:hypothetical protein [Mesobacillus zeae]RID83894.1 hypothetical protein D1970_14950 [Mesobacillus zeae]